MGYVHCCASLRESKSYAISPEEGCFLAQLDFLDKCPVCGHTVVQLTKIDSKNNVSIYRKINEKARKLFNKLKGAILFERKIEGYVFKSYSKFYLYYNEFGIKKKCYSNLSTLKMGLFENKELRSKYMVCRSSLPLKNYK